MNPEIINKLEKSKSKSKKLIKKILYKRYNKTYDFTNFKTRWSFGGAIIKSIITMDMANDEQKQLAQSMRKFPGNTTPRNLNIRKKRER